MNLLHRIRQFVVVPFLLAFLAAALGVTPIPASAQNGNSIKQPAADGAKSAKPHSRKTSGKKSVARRHRRQRGQKAPTTERISEIQSALAKDGSYEGEPTGKWDGNTVEAMKKFQATHGLNPSGKIDALSLQKLGLGSETAGVAAPLPPVSSLPQDAAANPSRSARRQ